MKKSGNATIHGYEKEMPNGVITPSLSLIWWMKRALRLAYEQEASELLRYSDPLPQGFEGQKQMLLPRQG
jgi:hypothetical protein